ncbi:MAG: ethanolamine utilization protein EutQ [Pseudomonadota bacterium]
MQAQAQVMSYANRRFLPRFSHGDMAQIAKITGTEHATRLGTGFARFRQAEIPWQVKYDEVVLVIEGRLKIRTEQEALEAGPRDCIWLPKDTKLTYLAEDALVFYAIDPANWAVAGT